MPLSATLNDIPRPFWIVLMVLGFVWHWPLGLLVLGYLVGSGRIGRGRCGPGRWYNSDGSQPNGFWGRRGWGNWGPQPNGPAAPAGSSNNHAFDEYRAETLRRLEEEQKEFVDYLDRLRQARDKAEFDQFMADRRGRPGPVEPHSPQG